MAKILLVEDEDVQRKAMEAILRSGGHEVSLAGNGAQALLVAQSRTPEVLISDLAMPKMDGTELCQKVRATRGLEDVYVILVTAREGEGVKLESLLAGTDDFVHKPISKDDLLGRIQIGLRIRKLRMLNQGMTGRLERLEKTQESLVGALDTVIRGMEEAVDRLHGEDTAGAMASLREAHEEIRRTLSSVVMDEPS